nr:MAG TPA: hypothetical protein [Caudoviricetes sp.]
MPNNLSVWLTSSKFFFLSFHEICMVALIYGNQTNLTKQRNLVKFRVNQIIQ